MWQEGLRSCCAQCISPLHPACAGGLFLLLSPSQSGFGSAVPRKQALSPSETRVLCFCNVKCTWRKPSFMAIIAQLITLWRLQTCVIYIFLSSHLAPRLENASVRRVNLAFTQPSPFSPATPIQTLPVLVLSKQSHLRADALLPTTLRCLPCSTCSPWPCSGLWESGISFPGAWLHLP